MSLQEIPSQELQEFARRIRIETLKMVYCAQSGHIGGSFSVAEILTALYRGGIMQHDPQNPLWEGRDRLVYSKGHASPALYATLAMCGYFSEESLKTFRDFGSPLQGHPVMQGAKDGCPGVEFSGGSLGQGLSFGIGQALFLKRRGFDARVFVISSDGDFQEGQTQEALMSACKDWANTQGVDDMAPQSPLFLDNLVLVIDVNGFQNDTATDKILPVKYLTEILGSYGWKVYECKRGNDLDIVLSKFRLCFSAIPKTGPIAFVFSTVKGKGVSLMENQPKWHGEAPNDDEFTAAMRELGATKDEIQKTIEEKQQKQEREKNRQLFLRGKKGARDAFGDAVKEIMAQDEKVYALCADLAKSVRFDRIARAYPERFFNVGIQEQNMAGVAAGLAVSGNTVFISTFARFGGLAYERVLQQIAANNLPAILLLSHAGLTTGKDGKSAQTFEQIALWRILPHMKVVVPADYWEAKAAILAAYRAKGPAVIFASRENFPELYEEHYRTNAFEFGKSRVYHIGKDVTIISCGLMTHFALKVVEDLRAGRIDNPEIQALDIGVINMASLKPIDEKEIIQAAQTSRAIVVAEEHSRYGGLTSAVCEILAEHEPVPVETVSIDDAFGTSGDSDALLSRYYLDHASILAAIARVYKRKFVW